MSRALRNASLVAATIKSCSISASPDLSTSGSIFNATTCMAPLTLTVTMPPPAVPSTVLEAACSWILANCSCMA